MKQLILSFLLMLLPLMASADAVEIDGIYYNLNSETKQAEVVRNPNGYTGDLAIPDVVTYENVDYSVTSIVDQAFQLCTSLTSIVIPNSMTSIGNHAFYGCSNLTSVTIPNSVAFVGLAAFDGTAWYNNQPDGLVYAGRVAYKYKGAITANTYFTIIDGTLGITENAFSNCSGISSVKISKSVKSIGDCAFYGCNLTLVVVEADNPPAYGWKAFPKNPQIVLIVPAGSRAAYQSALGWSAFQNIIEDGETVFIDQSADLKYETGENNTASVIRKYDSYYRGHTGFSNVVVPDKVEISGVEYSVTSIGEKAFYQCDVKTATIGNNVTSIGDAAFEWCSDVNLVTIPKSVMSIGIYAFAESNLKYVVSEIENPFAITNNVFKTTHPKLIVPKGTKAKYQETDGWKDLSIVEDGDVGSVFEIEGIYYERRMNHTVSIASVSTMYFGNIMIPDQVTFQGITYKVTSINTSAFRGCYGLTFVIIPNSVSYIGSCAFADCWRLKSVIIPNSTTFIGTYAFGGCNSLISVVSEVENPFFSFDKGVFNGVPSDAKLFVPKGTKAKYESTEGWNYFTNIIEVDEGDANCDGAVNESDVNDVVCYIMDQTPNVFMRSAADMNGDNKIDAADIVLMNNMVK